MALYCGLLFTLVFYIFYVNFTAYCLFFLLFVYSLLVIFLLQLGLEFLALFILMTYIGGLMIIILFVFFLFSFDSSANVSSTISFESVFFAFIAVVYVFYPILLNFSFNNILGVGLTADLALIYSLTDGLVYGFDWDYSFYLGPTLYVVYFLPLLNCFLIFLVVLFGIAGCSDNFLFYSQFFILTVNSNNFSGLDYIAYCELLGLTEWWGLGGALLMLSISLILSSSFLNFINIIIFLELVFVSIVYMLVISSYYFYDLVGVVFIIILLGLYAAETSLGLLIFVTTSKSYLSFNSNNF